MKHTQRTKNAVLFSVLAIGVTWLAGCSDTAGYIAYVELPAEPQDFDTEWTIPDSLKPAEKVEPSQPEMASTKQAQEEIGDPTVDDSAKEATLSNTAASAATDIEVSTDQPSKDAEQDGVTTSKPAPSDEKEESSTEESSTEEASTVGGSSEEEPLKIKLLISEKRFRSEDDFLRVSYDDIDLLKILNMQPVPVDADRYFPDWLRNLDGKPIRIRGFMYPTFEATGLTRFSLARDNGICCFVRQPKVYDIIGVDLKEGETTDYIDGKPFDVEGVFQIAPEADDTELYQLYRIADAKVLN